MASIDMRVVIVRSEEEAQAAKKAIEATGYRLGCVSNAGLPKVQFRLTFLPASAFTDHEPAPSEKGGR